MSEGKGLLTVGEVAEITGVTRRIIINYEANGLIKPDTRGEFDSGYRYYSMDTLVRIRTIRAYQNLGLSLSEIKDYLDDASAAKSKADIARHESEKHKKEVEALRAENERLRRELDAVLNRIGDQ